MSEANATSKHGGKARRQTASGKPAKQPVVEAAAGGTTADTGTRLPHGTKTIRLEVPAVKKRAKNSEDEERSSREIPVATRNDNSDTNSLIKDDSSLAEGFYLIDPYEQLFTGLDEKDSQTYLAVVVEIFHRVRSTAKEKLQPRINELLKIIPPTYTGKVELSRQINAVLKAAGLAIQDPETGLPAKLLPNRSRPTPTSSSYLLLRDTKKSDNGKQHYLNIEELDKREFELIDAADAEQGMAADQFRSIIP